MAELLTELLKLLRTIQPGWNHRITEQGSLVSIQRYY